MSFKPPGDSCGGGAAESCHMQEDDHDYEWDETT